MTLKFNPPRDVAKYALFVEYENGRASFKAYDLVGSAKNAYPVKTRHMQKTAKILENVGGDWYVLYDIDPKGDHVPWHKETRSRGWRNVYTVWRGVPMTREEYGDWRAKVERERITEANYTFVPSNFEV